ncbi:MAG: UDP-N-acetylmuramate--L-alanine ligase [Acidimicrobiia bacterium]|nr:UDP-N-acetylmuramate--L-alanine ligase [Acidimicrobiia bacterium]
MTWLDGYDRVHLVGVGGSGMSGLAKLLAQSGHTVTGSDLKRGPAFQALEGIGIECWTGHRPERVVDRDLVVYSSAVPDERDAEVVAAREAGVPTWERPALLAEMTRTRPALGLSGTHGKTTSSAMTVAALRALGRDPTFMVGGRLADLNTNAHVGEPSLFVLEADEAYSTFLGLALEGMVVTNVEIDHLDHYETMERLTGAFEDVAGRVDGPVLACIDDPGSAALVESAGAIPYGTGDGAAWRIEDPEHVGHSVAFTLARGSDSWRVTVPRPGMHVARNATGVLAMLGERGFDVATAAQGLASFGGVRRRFDVRARTNGITVVDDYAHHPTEIAATIAAGRLGGPDRVVAVFQAHHFDRTARLADEFGEALATADLAVVTDVYAPGEAPIPGVTGRLLAEKARDAGGEVVYVPRRIDLAAEVAGLARPGDLVLVMGAGDIYLVPDELATLLADA